MSKRETKKTSYLMHNDWSPMLSKLSNEDLGEVMHAIISFQDGVEYEIANPLLAAIFEMIRAVMQNDLDKYNDTCEQRAQNGAKGGRPKKIEDSDEESEKANGFSKKPKKANGFLENQTKAKKADSDCDCDNDCDSNISPLTPLGGNPTKQKRVDYERIVAESNLSTGVRDKLLEWSRYKVERKEGYKETGFRSLVKQAENHCRSSGDDAVIKVIGDSMASNYKGIVWDRLDRAGSSPPRNSFVNFDQRKNDYADLERSLLGSRPV